VSDSAKNDTVVIALDSSELAVPFQASPLPFGMPFPSSRSPTPMRPTRKRRNPGRYSSSEYELDLMETKSANGDVFLLPPVRSKSPSASSLRESTSPESSSGRESRPLVCVSFKDSPARASLGGWNVGYGAEVADGSCDVTGVGCANLPGDGTEGAEDLQVQLVATKREQYEMARRIILKAQREIRRKDQDIQRKVELSSSLKEVRR